MRVVAEKLRTLPPVIIYEPEYVELIAEAGDPTELTIEHLGSTWVITGTLVVCAYIRITRPLGAGPRAR